MIVLPEGAFIVQQYEAPEKEEETTPKLILSMDDLDSKPKKPNVGTVLFTSKELNKYQGMEVVFRENFSEDITINNLDLLYFRDFNSSIYYVRNKE